MSRTYEPRGFVQRALRAVVLAVAGALHLAADVCRSGQDRRPARGHGVARPVVTAASVDPPEAETVKPRQPRSAFTDYEPADRAEYAPERIEAAVAAREAGRRARAGKPAVFPTGRHLPGGDR